MVVLVASIPIALPVVATSTMAVGAQRLAQHNAVVSRLAAIEELAGMDILCSDKTGNLGVMCCCDRVVVYRHAHTERIDHRETCIHSL